eukprot:SAG25_NODE_800_length_5271_cov_4.461524_6_plen_66_part_00
MLRKMKAPGIDGTCMPVEIYQASPVCQDLLFELIDQIWLYEPVRLRRLTMWSKVRQFGQKQLIRI